jgi:Holliday junction resolvase RusA-like endonuclease
MAYYGVPKSKSKKVAADMLNGHILPTKKPDIDNIAKIILDGLNGIAWDDDKQIVELLVGKRYGEPSVIVAIEEMDGKCC